MSIHVDPNITVYSDCTRCCPRFLRVWLCCCCVVDPGKAQRVNQAALDALHDQDLARANQPSQQSTYSHSDKPKHHHHNKTKNKHKSSEPI